MARYHVDGPLAGKPVVLTHHAVHRVGGREPATCPCREEEDRQGESQQEQNETQAIARVEESGPDGDHQQTDQGIVRQVHHGLAGARISVLEDLGTFPEKEGEALIKATLGVGVSLEDEYGHVGQKAIEAVYNDIMARVVASLGALRVYHVPAPSDAGFINEQAPLTLQAEEARRGSARFSRPRDEQHPTA